MGRNDKPIPINHANPMLTLGANMRRVRHARGITLTAMAQRLGYTKSHVSGIENGTGRPSREFIEAYAHELGIELAELLPAQATNLVFKHRTPLARSKPKTMADTPQRNALRIDDSLLEELDLGPLTELENTGFLKSIYATLEMRVGTRLSEQMTNEQLDEFETFFNAQDDVGAFHWLEANFPNYKDVVADEFTKLKSEIASAHRDVTTHVFICNSHNDRDIANQLTQKFQSVGIRVWVEHEHVVPATSDWEREIRQNIKRSNGIVYIATEEAATSPFVRDELAIARDRHIPIYAIWARGDFWSDCIPLGWGRTHFVDGRGDRFDGAVLSLIASLKKARGAS